LCPLKSHAIWLFEVKNERYLKHYDIEKKTHSEYYGKQIMKNEIVLSYLNNHKNVQKELAILFAMIENT
jgi:hypothetical protein